MGLWKERKRPRRARSSGSIANRSWPLKSALPPVTSYEGWPTSTFVNVLLPDPFLPMMACVSPSLMVSVTPFRISSPVSATLAVRSFTSSSTSPFAARTLSAEARAPLAPRAIFPDAPKRARAFLLEESPAADARAHRRRHHTRRHCRICDAASGGRPPYPVLCRSRPGTLAVRVGARFHGNPPSVEFESACEEIQRRIRRKVDQKTEEFSFK